MMRLAVVMLASMFSLSGCSSFYTGGAISDVSTSLVLLPREQQWAGALSAADIAELAIKNSLALKAEKNSLEARNGAWRLGFRGFLPRLELSAGSDERLSFYSSDSFSKNLSVSITQPVWDGGRLMTARALESAGMELARAELERKARTVSEAAISAARAVLTAGARLEIKRTSCASASLQRFILMTEIDLGLAMDADLAEVETSLAEMDIELADAALELSTAQSELAEALCVDRLPELSERLDIHKPTLHLEPGIVVAMAVERSPELSLARYSVIKKQTEYKASRYSWLPTIGFKVSGFVSGSEYPLNRATWSAGMTLDFRSPYLSGTGSAQLVGEPPSFYTARTNNSIELLPEPVDALESRQAGLALALEYESYSIKLAQVERSARAAMVLYENSVHRRDLATRLLELAELKLQLIALKASLGQALRSELIKTELERATSEVELVDVVAALETAERGLEHLFDIPPGTLASFFSAREAVLP